MLGLTESYTHFQAYQQSLLDKPLESVDWVTIKEDQDFEKGIPRSLRRTVYCSAIRSGNATHWEFLRQRLSVKGNDHEEMYNILQGLSCSSNVETMKKYSNWILQNEDLQYVLSDIASSPTGNQVLCQSAIDELKSVVNGQRLVELLDTLSEYGDVLIDVAKQAEVS
ncbi:unnamed protein product [Trichobilharzia regenti]|nr:unnamed protein product [Trichobilharzia regenti]